ncbi:hypothetical protein V6N12_061253 [Hibiscus sabdariffa]|uniref:Uncharacterized protein n=1 Tax=Hibiscus sabdariffa TaxID=183260 RepID=A0ABR2DWI3_9ROSI
MNTLSLLLKGPITIRNIVVNVIWRTDMLLVTVYVESTTSLWVEKQKSRNGVEKQCTTSGGISNKASFQVPIVFKVKGLHEGITHRADVRSDEIHDPENASGI